MLSKQKYYEWYYAIFEPKVASNEKSPTSKQENNGYQEKKHAY